MNNDEKMALKILELNPEIIADLDEELLDKMFEFEGQSIDELKTWSYKIVLGLIQKLEDTIKTRDTMIEQILDLIFQYGQIGGEHHKMWIIDQIVRILTVDKYDDWVKNYSYDTKTGDTYTWNIGIAP